MPNNTVSAAATGLPEINRRRMLLGIAAASTAAATVTVATAAAPADNKGWHDDSTLMSMWATLEQVIRDLEPVRNRLQGVEGGVS